MVQIKRETEYYRHKHETLFDILKVVTCTIGSCILCPCAVCVLVVKIISGPKCCTEIARAREARVETAVAVHFEHQGRSVQRRKSLSIGTRLGPLARLCKKPTCNQMSSPLFSRLPPELRTFIFEMALSGTGAVCIGVAYDYPARFPQLKTTPCEPTLEPTLASRPRAVPDQVDRILGLLCTCRRVYTEVLPILYTQNRFFFGSTCDFDAFFHITPRAHLRYICTIRVDYRDSSVAGLHGQLQWPPALLMKALGSMDSLRSLYLCFSVYGLWYEMSRPPLPKAAEKYVQNVVGVTSERCMVYSTVFRESELFWRKVEKGARKMT